MLQTHMQLSRLHVLLLLVQRPGGIECPSVFCYGPRDANAAEIFASPKSGPQVQGVRELPHVGAGRQKTLADAPLRATRPSLSVRFLSADASPDAAKTRTLLLGPRRTRRRVRALGISSSRPRGGAATRPDGDTRWKWTSAPASSCMRVKRGRLILTLMKNP